MIRHDAPIERRGSRFALATTKYARTVFGDSNVGRSFRPTGLYSAFGDETGCIFGYPTSKNIRPKRTGGRITWTDGDTEVHFYEHASRERWDSGAIETEIFLGKKPAKAEVAFRFECSGLKLHVQPELSAWEVARGNKRPRDLIGGICAYHATKTPFHFIRGDADRYKAGKAFEIPRPTATDAHGVVVLGTWRHEPRQSLLVAVFERFAFAALDWSRGVLVGPTIGYTTLGASADGTGQFALANPYTAADTSDASAGTAWYGGSRAAGAADVYIAIYDFGDGNVSGNSRLAFSSAISVSGVANAWFSAAITPGAGTIASGTQYFIENYSNTTGVITAYDATGNTDQYTATTTATPPATHATRGGTQNIQPSGYVDFTAAAGGPSGPPPGTFAMMKMGV